MNRYMPIAASNWQDLVVPVVILIMVASSWIFNKLKELQAPPSQAGDGDEAAKQQQIDDVASRRREHSEQMAKQRSGAPSTGEPARTEPENLTLAERIERARARAQYQNRAEMLRGQRAQGTQKLPVRPTDVARSVPRPQPVATSPPSPQSTWTAPSAPRLAALRRPSTEPAFATKRIQTKRKVADVPSPEPARGVVKAKLRPGRTISAFTKGLGGRSLRQAIVLKEILDRPVCLRDSFDALS